MQLVPFTHYRDVIKVKQERRFQRKYALLVSKGLRGTGRSEFVAPEAYN